jgi:ribonuclease P protein component
VARNRAKRLVRELFRRHAGELARGIDVVVVVRPGTQDLGLADLERELQGAKGSLARRGAECAALRPRG